MSSYNPNILVRLVLSSLFAGEGREKKRQRNFPKITQLVRGRAGIGTRSSSGACAQKAAAAFCWSFWNDIYISSWTAAHQAFLSFTTSQSLLKLMSIDLMMASHPLLPPSPPALNLSQHGGLFQWIGSLHQVAKALELQLRYQSFHWIFGRTISPGCRALSLTLGFCSGLLPLSRLPARKWIPLNATDPYDLGGHPRRAKKGKSRQALSPSHLPSGGLLLIRNLVLAQEELTPFLQYSPVPLLDRGECERSGG